MASKLNKQMMADFEAALRRVFYLKHATAMVGLARPTTEKWRKRGREALEAHGSVGRVPKVDRRYAEFYAMTERVRGEMAAEMLDKIQAAGDEEYDGDWKAKAWILERAYPYDFGRKDRVEHTGDLSFDVAAPAIVDNVRGEDE